jgi:hypothetical protein
MKLARNRILVTVGLIAIAGMLAPLRAQDKQAAANEPKKLIPLKVVVVVTELDGAKKISSLPYSFYVNSDDVNHGGTSQVRVGLRVPVATGTVVKDGATVNTQFQYMDINTSIDCTAYSMGEGKFKLTLSVDRNYLGSAESNKALPAEGVTVGNGNPIMQHFSSSYNLLIRDGQTIEATSTTDPVSGRVLQVSVSVNVVK